MTLDLVKVGEGDGDGGTGDAEDAVEGLEKALGGGEPAATLPGVDGPDVLNAEAGVVVDTLMKVSERVVF